MRKAAVLKMGQIKAESDGIWKGGLGLQEGEEALESEENVERAGEEERLYEQGEVVRGEVRRCCIEPPVKRKRGSEKREKECE